MVRSQLDLSGVSNGARVEYSTDTGRMPDPYVPETRFGIWFLHTEIWADHVLERAVADLDRLIANRQDSYSVVVDIGCGWGRSFKLLHERFRPDRMIGIDIDTAMIEAATEEVAKHNLLVEFQRTSSSRLTLPDESVDIVFCHQTFHHLIDQEAALREFHRVLKPKGLLLFAESTRKYIHSWIIRLLFRHPMDVQRTAQEYLTMISKAGFSISSGSISYPYLWWSRGDLGIMEGLFGVAPPAKREETLLNLIAIRSANEPRATYPL